MSNQTQQPQGWGPSPPNQPAGPKAPKARPFRAGFLGCFGVLAAAAVIGIVIAALASSGSKRTPTAPAVTQAPSAATEPATTAKPAPQTWATVLRAGGRSSKRSGVFTLHGGRARLTYTVADTSGTGAVLVAVYVIAEGDSLAKSGGIPEVTVSEPGTDQTELAQGPGRYYLDVNAGNARWTVTIQELR